MLGKRLINSNSAAAGGSCTTDTLQILGDTSCIAYYKMSDATDESGNFDGTPTSVNFNVAGKFGNAAQFNGSSSKINLPQTYGAEGENFSYSFWFKTTTSGDSIYDSQNIISKRNGANTFHLNITNANTLLVSDWSGTMNKQSSTTVTDGVWRHIVFTYSNSSGLVYINGSVETSMSFTVNLPTQSISLGNNIGNWDGNSRNFGGSIDQIRVFNKALSSSEVTTLYNEVQCVPTIVPTDYFEPVLYTGNGGTKSITSLDFAPDWVWIKSRDFSNRNHRLFDSVRGATKVLSSDITNAEVTELSLTSFNTNGFTLGSAGNQNNTSEDYVAWNWKAGGADVQNTDGTITSQVSANTDAGFSIVEYSGTSINGTIGHGLDSAPELYITKGTDGANAGTIGWYVYSKPTTATHYLELNSTNAASDNNLFWNDTEPTDSVFSVANNGVTNGTGENYIAYCFHSVDGMTRVGSYVGGGSTDVPINLGFRPAFVMLKNATDSGGSDGWVMYDNKRQISAREPQNDNILYANYTLAEQSDDPQRGIEFNSNGFVANQNYNPTNGSGDTIIFLAIAEEVFNPNGVTRNATNPFGDGSEKALYKFEDNGNDAYGNYTANSISYISYSSGYIDKAAAWNGTNSFMRVPISFNTNAAYSISFWAKLGVGSNDHCYFWQIASGGTSQTALQLAPDNYGTNNLFRFYFNHQGVTNSGTSSIPTFTPTGGWQHFVGTFDGSALGNLYIDGNNVQSNFALSPKANVDTNLLVGGNLIYGGSTQYKPLTGLDQVRMYTKALDSGEVTQLYNE